MRIPCMRACSSVRCWSATSRSRVLRGSRSGRGSPNTASNSSRRDRMADDFLKTLENVRGFLAAMLKGNPDEASVMTLASVHTEEEAQEWLLILCGVILGMAKHVTENEEAAIEFVNHILDDARDVEIQERAQSN